MDSPTSRIIGEASAVITVQDSRGRTLSVRRVSALDRLRLFKALGPDLAENAPYLGMGLLAISVTAVDNVPVPSPVTEGHLEALVQRLGDDGLEAVSAVWREHAAADQELNPAGN